MRADETGAGASRGGMMPPVTSRPGVRTTQSMAIGDTIAPPSVWRPAPDAQGTQTPPELKAEAVIELPETAPVEEASEPVGAAAEPAGVESAETYEPWAEAAATEPETAVEEELRAEPAPTAFTTLVEDEPWAEAAVTETEAPADFEPWAQAPVTEPETTGEPPLEIMPMLAPAPNAEPGAEPVTEPEQEPTPLVEEFALDSFLMAPTEPALVEEPDIEEPAFERQVEEPVAEMQPGELAYEAPPVDDVVTEAPAAQEATSPTDQMRERLEKIAQDLRGGDANEVIKKLAAGDRLDALLAGLLAGFLARSGD